MEVKNKNVRCVNKKTGAVSFNNAIYAYDKSWQKSTGNYPQPEPKAEDFTNVTKEQKPNTNAKTTETAKNDGRGNSNAAANA